MYVTEYEEIDIAVGFPNIEDIKNIWDIQKNRIWIMTQF